MESHGRAWQTAYLASRRGGEPTLLVYSTHRSRSPSSQAPERREAFHAAFQANAGHRAWVPRVENPAHHASWRIIYFVDTEAIVILEVFAKRTRETPGSVVKNCKRRLRLYKEANR